jgi:DNA mismatch endonuclease (patch repair protein)
MSRQVRKGTAPELALRQELFHRGLRYRLGLAVPGVKRRSIDIAFTRQRLAVFVDGCFWHGCPEHGNAPRANVSWWTEKLAANQGRDADTNAALLAAGWTVLRVWEHDCPLPAADRVLALLAGAPT